MLDVDIEGQLTATATEDHQQGKWGPSKYVAGGCNIVEQANHEVCLWRNEMSCQEELHSVNRKVMRRVLLRVCPG